MIRFEWDERKNQINIKKHGVSFEQASTSFFDEEGIIITDEEHSDNEERFVLLGLSEDFKLLVICHCYKTLSDDDEIIRIISARLATKKEEKYYWEDRYEKRI